MICSIRSARSFASASRTASCSRSTRTARRSASSESKSPTSRANASSSSGSCWRFTSCRVTRMLRVWPRFASSGKSSGKRTIASSVSPGSIPMICSSTSGIARPSQHQLVGLRVLHLCTLARRDRHVHEILGLRFFTRHGRPRRFLRAQLVQLRHDLLVRDRRDLALQVELPDALELHVGLHLDVEFERDRGAPPLPLEIVDVRVGDGLQGLLLQRHLPAGADQLLQRLLANVLGEVLQDERGRRLAAAEPREPRPLLIARGGALFRLPHLFHGHGDGQGGRPWLFAGLANLNGGHVTRNLIGARAYGFLRRARMRRCGLSPGLMSSYRTTLIAPSGSRTASITVATSATPCSRSAWRSSSRVMPARWRCSASIWPLWISMIPSPASSLAMPRLRSRHQSITRCHPISTPAAKG